MKLVFAADARRDICLEFLENGVVHKWCVITQVQNFIRGNVPFELK